MAWLESEKKVVRRENRIGLPAETARFDERRARLVAEIERIMRDGKYATPRPDELPQLLSAPAAEVESLLEYLCLSGALVRLGKNVVFHSHWMAEAERLVVDCIERNGVLDSADFKNMIHSSRKYALALLDYFDAVHVTSRVGNLRRLHPAYLRKRGEIGSRRDAEDAEKEAEF
ncbi:SelB C-terminal domain-containing protein [bacterium]|nr:SelB C-terminal domain-containing protein [bacterium]